MLEAVSGRKVRSFSVPYGSSADLTSDLVAHLQRSGYEAVFLAESRANPPCPDRFRLNRVSIRTGNDGALFSEIEILPRLRTIRNSLFGAAKAEPCWSVSDLENLRQTSWPRTSDEGAGIGAEVPGAIPGLRTEKNSPVLLACDNFMDTIPMNRDEFLLEMDEILDLPAGTLRGHERLEELQNWDSTSLITFIAWRKPTTVCPSLLAKS